jgi:hypothetical protein
MSVTLRQGEHVHHYEVGDGVIRVRCNGLGTHGPTPVTFRSPRQADVEATLARWIGRRRDAGWVLDESDEGVN